MCIFTVSFQKVGKIENLELVAQFLLRPPDPGPYLIHSRISITLTSKALSVLTIQPWDIPSHRAAGSSINGRVMASFAFLSPCSCSFVFVRVRIHAF